MMRSRPVLSDVIGNIYDAAADESLWTVLLERLTCVCHAESAALLLHQGPESHVLAASWQLNSEGRRKYEEYYGTVDVWTKYGQLKPAGYVGTSESLCPLPELAQTEFYNDFLVHQDVGHGMFGLAGKDAFGRTDVVSLYRGVSSGPFQNSDLRIFSLLFPHIRRAFTLRNRISQLTTRSEGLERALDAVPTGIVFVGAKHDITFMNHKAEDILSRSDGLLLLDRRLTAAVAEESRGLQAMIAGVVRTSNGKGSSAGGTTLISRKNARPLSLTVAPLCNVNFGLTPSAHAVVFVSDPDDKCELPVDVLRRCYGLTPAETKVVMALLQGCSLKEVAEICGVTHNTAKSQLKSIFLKTDVQRQSELMKLLLLHSSRIDRVSGRD